MLEIAYLKKLGGMLAAAEKCVSCLEKLSAAAFTDELRMGLSPASSDQLLHIQRLKQCLNLKKGKKTKDVAVLDQLLLKMGKDVVKGKIPSLEKDLNLVHTGQQIFQQKIQGYISLKQMAVALGTEQSAVLLEQCFKDEQNAYNYLLQISQNIIYPKAVSA